MKEEERKGGALMCEVAGGNAVQARGQRKTEWQRVQQLVYSRHQCTRRMRQQLTIVADQAGLLRRSCNRME